MAQNGATIPQGTTNIDESVEEKGKGKAVAGQVPADSTMDEDDDDDDDDEEDDEEDVCTALTHQTHTS